VAVKKILAVATNHAADLNGKRTGCWLSELTHFLDVVERANFDYELVSPQGGAIPLDERSTGGNMLKDPVTEKYMADARFRGKLESSTKCSDVDTSDSVAIYLSGGHGTVFDFRQSAPLQKLITEMYSANRYVAAVCHGVGGFIDSKDQNGEFIVRNKVVTGFSNLEETLAGAKKAMPFLLEDELKKHGAKYKKNIVPFTERVEVDGKLITGQNPQSAKAVGVKLVEMLRAS
jgi:putative intracellular protease/amidase